jgi:DNA-directed RNA polymerase specialized sigma subunit
MGKLLPFEFKVIAEVVIQGEKVAKLARRIGYSRGHVSDIKTNALQKMRDQLTAFKEAA